MFEAQLLISKSDPYTVFSPWFPRQGDNFTMTLEVAEVDGAEITVQAFSKNSEDAGNGTSIGSSISSSTVGTTDGTVTGAAEEMVRYQFSIDGSGNAGKWSLFRMLPVVWFDSV